MALPQWYVDTKDIFADLWKHAGTRITGWAATFVGLIGGLDAISTQYLTTWLQSVFKDHPQVAAAIPFLVLTIVGQMGVQRGKRNTADIVNALLAKAAAGASVTTVSKVAQAVANTQPAPGDPPSSTTGASTVKSVLLALTMAGVALVAASLTGCAEMTKLEQKITSPGGQVVSQIAVDLAVGAVVGNDTASKTRAANIKSVAQKVLAADQGTTVSLSALVAVASDEIAKLKLQPAEQAAATLLVQSLSGLAANVLAPGPNASPSSGAIAAANVQVVIAQLMNQVILATSGYRV